MQNRHRNEDKAISQQNGKRGHPERVCQKTHPAIRKLARVKTQNSKLFIKH